MINELSYADVHFEYNLDDIPLNCTRGETIGQERALEALRIGLRNNRGGYNIFVSGDVGTGRLSAVRQEAEKLRDDVSYINDVAYGANPITPSEPICLVFKQGKGRELASTLEKLDENNYKEELIRLASKEENNAIKEYLLLISRYPYSPSFMTLNLVLDRTGEKKRPFIIDSHPSFTNLFGYYDKSVKTPHMGIRVGSYAKAAGGFLVLTAEELLSEKGLWDELKRHLDSTQMALTSSSVQGSIGKDEHIRPQSVPLQTKVILLGSEDIYDELAEKDEQFLRLFKSSPQFDYQMDVSEKTIEGTSAYLEELVLKEDRVLSKEALAELLRYSSWFCESREKLSTQLSLLGDLLTEAILSTNNKEITKEDIKRALKGRDYITGISEERINQEIKEGDLLINVFGSRIGVINGLAVMDRGLASFGTPAVISATVAPGSEGIVNIEHEAGLSGEIHDKGILILEGYLRKQYARSFPLSIYAGLCFEQNYSEVDGDSASSSELYALLSAIGELPVRQDIAITGSVNQMGLLQPVGGINEKITGFWKTCKSCGLTGTQGVVIPKQNIKSLILSNEVEEDIKEGRFHIWALSTIEEGMELLTGLKAGVRDRKGVFPLNSFNRIIEDRLKKLYESVKGS